MNRTTIDPAMTEEEETKRGTEIARILRLKTIKDSNGKRYNPERYDTTHGTKTALGLFRTLAYQINQA